MLTNLPLGEKSVNKDRKYSNLREEKNSVVLKKKMAYNVIRR